MSVPTQLFQEVKREENLVTFQSRYPHATMVLRSQKSHIPLAAVVLMPNDTANVQAVVTARPPPTVGQFQDQPHFQGMLNRLDQPFGFYLANLTSEGYLNMNLLHTAHRVEEKDPGATYGLNQVNEIRPGQAYLVKRDQRTQRQMVLLGHAQGQVLTRVQDMEAQDTRNERMMIHLSVTPSTKSTQTVKWFQEGTEWVPTPVMVIPLAPRPSVPKAIRFGGRSRGARTMPYPPPMGERPPSEELQSLATFSFGQPERHMALTLGINTASTKESVSMEVEEPTQAVGKSIEGRMGYGQHLTENVGVTDEEYAYDVASAPAILRLSIWREMQLKPFNVTDYADYLTEWRQHLGRAQDQQLAASVSHVFKSDHCCIDLESPADTVIVRCGHQCIHHTHATPQLKACPLCRSPVTGFLSAQLFE